MKDSTKFQIIARKYFPASLLRGKSTSQRTLALIGIAHPNFRDELLKQAKDLGYI